MKRKMQPPGVKNKVADRVQKKDAGRVAASTIPGKKSEPDVNQARAQQARERRLKGRTL
jgi:hypothetical protein